MIGKRTSLRFVRALVIPSAPNSRQRNRECQIRQSVGSNPMDLSNNISIVEHSLCENGHAAGSNSIAMANRCAPGPEFWGKRTHEPRHRSTRPCRCLACTECFEFNLAISSTCKDKDIGAKMLGVCLRDVLCHGPWFARLGRLGTPQGSLAYHETAGLNPSDGHSGGGARVQDPEGSPALAVHDEKMGTWIEYRVRNPTTSNGL
jgi:hypothetical protein